jgi:phasin family protein
MPTTKAAQAVKNTTEQVADSAEAATAHGVQAMRDNVERAMAAASEVNSFGKENFEAWVASGAAATRGIEAISARAVAYSKSAVEAHMSAAKSIMTAKSVQELVEKQSEYARSAFDGYVAEINSLSDLMSGFAKDAMKPFNERVSAVSHLMQTARVR